MTSRVCELLLQALPIPVLVKFSVIHFNSLQESWTVNNHLIPSIENLSMLMFLSMDVQEVTETNNALIFKLYLSGQELPGIEKSY